MSSVVVATLVPAAALAQAPSSASTTVHATQATTPPGMNSEHLSMSGLPLQVGDLPPGVLVVRVIRQSFSENVRDVAVELHDSGGRVLEARTDDGGRARFDGLAVGTVVRARAVIAGEVLESRQFGLPARGGVRLVLVAGVGAGIPAATPVMSSSGPSTPQAGVRDTSFATLMALGMISLGGVFVWVIRRGGRRGVLPRP